MDRDNERKEYLHIEPAELPKGGAAYQGLGEEFDTDLFTGNIGLTIPIHITPCRNYEPQLKLTYSPTSGNGIFGMGFSLCIPYMERQSTKKIPLYIDEKDVFVSALFGELTPAGTAADVDTYKVALYQPVKNDCRYQVEYWRSEEESHWKVISDKNEISLYGTDEESRLGQDRDKVFCWYLKETEDALGNRTLYRYDSDGENRYIKSIFYGNYMAEGEERYCFEVRFDYNGEAGSTNQRPDAYFSYRSGFPVRMDRLCRKIEMVHHFSSVPAVVRSMGFAYEEGSVSLLARVEEKAYMGQAEGAGICQEVPGLEFAYTGGNPDSGDWRPLRLEEVPLPVEFNSPSYHFVDLYGEGIAGILYGDKSLNLYYEPLGEGEYAAPRVLEWFPADRNLQDGRYTVSSLEGDGVYDLVVESRERAGFYENNESGFQGFRAFAQYPNACSLEEKELADIQGDGLKHMLFADRDSIVYYPAKGKNGTGEPVHTMPPEGFPGKSYDKYGSVVGFWDILGDGLSHRVKVSDGLLEYWPCLGYGRFGDRRTMENTPAMEGGFDGRRVFFADTDGSGTQDLVYVYYDRAEIHRNQGGMYFQEPFRIILPEKYTLEDKICFCDIGGYGYDSMVFIKKGSQVRSYWYDFHQGQKPYLLKGMDNHMGCTANVEFKSSVSYFLKDKREGLTWESKVPFPVHVASRIEKKDLITGYTVIRELAYRHGYYDSELMEFAGFGRIDEIRREGIASKAYEGACEYSRYWYHTGRMGENYDAEFFAGDSRAVPQPLPAIEGCGGGCLTGPFMALKGNMIRKEAYEGDGFLEGQGPASIISKAYTVTEKVRPWEGRRGSYLVGDREEILHTYEKQVKDPRTRHSFVLQTDEFGNILQHLTVFYSRREGGVKGQESAKAYLSEKAYCNSCREPRVIGAEYLSKEYELSGFLMPEKGLSFDGAGRIALGCLKDIIDYAEGFTSGSLQARLEEWICRRYWNDAGTAEAGYGTAGKRLLVHHVETAVLPEQLTARYGQITDKHLREDCGYCLKDGYWWKQGNVCFYGPGDYYLPVQEESISSGNGSFQEDPLYRKSSYEYDPYSLMPIAVRQWEKDREITFARYRIDYDVMQYDWMKDGNDNIKEIRYNPLGQAEVISEYGRTEGVTEGSMPLQGYIREKGDFGSVLHSKEKYIQGAKSYYYYCLSAFETDRQPLSVIELGRPSPEEGACVRCRISYYDAGGRIIQERLETEEGFCVNSHILKDTGENDILEYAPYLSQSPYYEDSGLPPYKINSYDISGRLVKAQKAAGMLPDWSVGYVFSSKEYLPFEIREYDENDTIKDAGYFQGFMEQYPQDAGWELQDRKDALEKASAFYQSPNILSLDPEGNKCMDYLDQLRENKVEYLYGRNKRIRRIQSYGPEGPGQISMETIYTMEGDVFAAQTADSGLDITLVSRYRHPVHIWDGRGTHKICRYDQQDRLTETWVEGMGLMEKIIYGTGSEEDKGRNLWGQAALKYGQEGVTSFVFYDINKKLKSKTLQLCKQYKGFIDWSDSGSAGLEDEAYTEGFTYNWFGEAVSVTAPGNETIACCYDRRGLLSRISMDTGDGSRTAAAEIAYDAGGRLIRKVYGNGVVSEYSFDRDTLLLQGIHTAAKDGKAIRNLLYYYDPAENITRIRDTISGEVYCRQQSAKGLWDYTYDERYQLTGASGRELPVTASSSDYEKLESYAETYSYDGTGNMTKISHKSASTNWTSSMEMEEQSNRMVEYNGTALAYDAAGHMIQVPHLKAMQWNEDGRLQCVVMIERESGDNDCEYYVYDSDGQRVRKVTERKTQGGLEVTDKLYIGCYERKRIYQEAVLILDRASIRMGAEEKPLAVCCRWLCDLRGRETDMAGSTSIRYLTDDHLNSVSIETGEDGRILTVEEYYPFGATAVSFGEKYDIGLKEYRYCNKENDVHTGFYYYGSRYYCSAFCRMISPDSLGYVKPEDNRSLNRYRYCEDNPVRFVDWEGFCPVVLYHGTTVEGAQAIRKNGIDLRLSRTSLDFGRGFYLTKIYQQAEDWANRMEQNSTGNQYGGILKYSIPRADYDALNGRTFGKTKEDINDWEELVYACRSNAWHVEYVRGVWKDVYADASVDATANDAGKKACGKFGGFDYLQGTMLMTVGKFMDYKSYRVSGHQIAFRTQTAVDLLKRHLVQ